MTYDDLAEARRLVSKELGMPISDDLAEALEADLRDVAIESSEAARVAERARGIERGLRDGRRALAGAKKGALIEPSSTSYEATVSSLLASVARREAGVEVFRDLHLTGELMAREDVPSWVEARLGPEPGHRTLAYHDGSSIVRKRIPADGSLADLDRVSGSLCRKFPWAVDQAVMFVLTDLVPLVPRVRYRVRGGYPGAATRIVLEVDPAATPNEVAAVFKQARDAISPRPDGKGSRRPRVFGERTFALALAQMARPDDETWAESMAAWNASIDRGEHPEGWRAKETTNFARDTRAAVGRLLYPEYDPWRAFLKEDDDG